MGERCFKIRRLGLTTEILRFCRIFCNPLHPGEPPSPALPRSALGEVYFGAFTIEIGDADSDGSARDADEKAVTFAVKCISLSYGSCSGSRSKLLADVFCRGKGEDNVYLSRQMLF